MESVLIVALVVLAFVIWGLIVGTKPDERFRRHRKGDDGKD